MTQQNKAQILLPIMGLDVGKPSEYIDNRGTPDCQNMSIYRSVLKKRIGTTVIGDPLRVSTLVDSYSETNYVDYDFNLYATVSKCGQSFIATAGELSTCKFYLAKNGSPTGNITATLYASSGAFGTTETPTGSVLATSDTIDVSTLGAFALVEFTFTGAEQYTLVAGNYYFICLEYAGGDISNSVYVGGDSTSHDHDGRMAYYNTDWVSYGSADLVFYVYNLVGERILALAELYRSSVSYPVRIGLKGFEYLTAGTWTDAANAALTGLATDRVDT